MPALQAGVAGEAGGEDRKSVGSAGAEPNDAPGLCAGGDGRSLIGGQDDIPTPGFGVFPPRGAAGGNVGDGIGAEGTAPPTGLNGSDVGVDGSAENIFVNSPGPLCAGGAGGAGGNEDADGLAPGVSKSLVNAPASLAGWGGG